MGEWAIGPVEWIEKSDGGHRFIWIMDGDVGIAMVQVDEGDEEQEANLRLLSIARESVDLLADALTLIGNLPPGLRGPLASKVMSGALRLSSKL